MIDRDRLGGLLGALALLGHALPALWFAKVLLSLPMEGGGLVLGPFVGLPVLGFALMGVALAVFLVVNPAAMRYQAIAALVVAATFDLFAVTVGAPIALLGAALSIASVCLLFRVHGLRLY